MSSKNARDPEVLIVGQGLAGSVLAWQLLRRGVSFTVVDRGGVDPSGAPCASQVAAGLVTPVTGKRLTLDPRWSTLRTSSADLYRYAEERLQAELFVEKPSLRVLQSAAEQEQLRKRRDASDYALQAQPADPLELPGMLRTEFGAFWMPEAARLDVRRFVQLTREWLADAALLRTATLTPNGIEADAGGVRADSLGFRTGLVVFCQGAVPASELPPDCPPVSADKGELLEIDAPELEIDCVVHRGVWVAPQSSQKPSRYLVGSTFTWGKQDFEPTAEARESILSRLSELTTAKATVVEHAAAARPSTSTRVPWAAFSESQPRVGWFNGLGSKGVLWAPWCAARLADQCSRVSG
ncbi:MAG: FAD-dependent oxidoreductase [Planctomycetota bacterium]